MGNSGGTFSCARPFVRYPEKIIGGRVAVNRDVCHSPESENCSRVYESPWIIMGQIRRMTARTP
jgi:hypothetical protein